MVPLLLMALAAVASDASAAANLERFYIGGAHDPSAPVQGPDGAVWFTVDGGLGRVSPDGRVTVFRTPHLDPFTAPASLAGPLWFLDPDRAIVSRIDMAGQVSVVSRAFPHGARLEGIAAGGDGNLWITEAGADAIARMTPDGRVTRVARLPRASEPTDIVVGSHGSLWFAVAHGVGRITPAGALRLWRFRGDQPTGPIAAIPGGGVLVATDRACCVSVQQEP